jgi:hypothetical protein
MFNQTDHHRAPFHEMHKVTALLSYKYFMTLNIFIIEIIKIAAYEVKVFMEIITGHSRLSKGGLTSLQICASL